MNADFERKKLEAKIKREDARAKSRILARRWNGICDVVNKLLNGFPPKQWEWLFRYSKAPEIRRIWGHIESFDLVDIYRSQLGMYDRGLCSNIFTKLSSM